MERTIRYTIDQARAVEPIWQFAHSHDCYMYKQRMLTKSVWVIELSTAYAEQQLLAQYSRYITNIA